MEAYQNTSRKNQCVVVDSTRFTVVGQGMRVVRVPVDREQFKRDFLQEAIHAEPAELVIALVPINNA